jgi:hypothetical protein
LHQFVEILLRRAADIFGAPLFGVTKLIAEPRHHPVATVNLKFGVPRIGDRGRVRW